MCCCIPIIPDDFGPFGPFLVILNHSGSFWSFLVVPGPFWPFGVISVIFAIFDDLGQFWANSGSFRVVLVLFGHSGTFLAISGHFGDFHHF